MSTRLFSFTLFLRRFLLITAVLGISNACADRSDSPPVFQTQAECEAATGHVCGYRMCDYIPKGKTFAEVCGKNFRKGWGATPNAKLEDTAGSIGNRSVFQTQAECEAATGYVCAYQMCDYIPKGKTFAEVCGKNFRKGWSATPNAKLEDTAGSIADKTEIPFQTVKLDNHWRLKLWRLGRPPESERVYYGVIQNYDEFSQLWQHMTNWKRSEHPPWKPNRPPKPIMPLIDFDTKSLLWYWDRGSGASFSGLNSVTKHQEYLEANVHIHFSDFGSDTLNLWTIPKTDLPVRFVETESYDQRGP